MPERRVLCLQLQFCRTAGEHWTCAAGANQEAPTRAADEWSPSDDSRTLLARGGNFRASRGWSRPSSYGGVVLTDRTVTYTGPTVLWRLQDRDGHVLRATLIPGSPASTLVYFLDDQFERGENFAEWEPAIKAADRVKQEMLTDGWREV